MRESIIEAQAAKIFSMSAAYIRRYGWQKEGMGEPGKPRCSMGALASAYPKQEWDENLAELMYAALYKELDGLSLTQYNYKYKSGEMVAQLYERVAKKLSRKAVRKSMLHSV